MKIYHIPAAPPLYTNTFLLVGENGLAENVRDFLQIVKKGNEIGFKKFPNSHIQSYKLLEMFDIGKIVGGEFQYNYKVNQQQLFLLY